METAPAYDETNDRATRIGKYIGTAFAALCYICLIGIIANSFLMR